MSDSAPSSPAQPGPPAQPPLPDAFHATPNAESYVLQADALRRRQLRAALLYGSSRYWRRRQRVWPAVVAGGILAAVLAGVIVVAGAFDAQQVINDERRQGRDEPATTVSPQPSPPVVGEHASPAAGVPAVLEPARATPGPDPAVR
ncbi:hypothetical protein GCM10023224_10970 [Streptomonospora halophila]|uniref:Uncharacterized protein n=1 Tax=Streptomonospora halophila TaxID=427369 RepID=A0ABP9G888_9ACTN